MNLRNISREVKYFAKHRIFNVQNDLIKEIIESRYVELVCFTLMPNHFHLILKESKENGISRYMQRILNSYTKYFNVKNELSGHLFQGPFKMVHIEDDPQLLYLSAYIHRNIKEVKNSKEEEYNFSYSSFQDYLARNRWGRVVKNGYNQKSIFRCSKI